MVLVSFTGIRNISLLDEQSWKCIIYRVQGNKKYKYQVSASMALHDTLPMFTGIQVRILGFRSDSSGIEQYFRPLKHHSPCSLREPLIPANCCQVMDDKISNKESYKGIKVIPQNITSAILTKLLNNIPTPIVAYLVLKACINKRQLH